MKNVTRIKKSQTSVPRDDISANACIGRIGFKQQEVNRLAKECKEKVAALKAQYAEKIAPLVKDRDSDLQNLHVYAHAHPLYRSTDGKTITMNNGQFGWRMSCKRVESIYSDERIIKSLKKRKMTDYIRVTEKVDRKALLRDQPKVPGVQYKQQDEFFVDPYRMLTSTVVAPTVTEAIDK